MLCLFCFLLSSFDVLSDEGALLVFLYPVRAEKNELDHVLDEKEKRPNNSLGIS